MSCAWWFLFGIFIGLAVLVWDALCTPAVSNRIHDDEGTK